MTDPYLAEVLEGVERTGDPVEISVALHSGAVITGFVRRSKFFLSVTRDETARTAQYARDAKKQPVTLPVLEAQAQRFANLDADNEAGHITLSDITMLWSTGDGLSIKTLRLSTDAIAAWWVVRGRPIKAEKDASAFWLVGVSF